MATREVRLKSDPFRLTLDSRGNLLQLESPFTPPGGLFQGKSRSEPGFSWTVEVDGTALSQRSLSFGAPRVEGNANHFTGSSDEAGVELWVGVDELGPFWRLSLANPGPHKLTGAGFTLSRPTALGPELKSTFPYCAGWALPLDELEPGDEYSLDYPVKASMQWISLYSQDLGIYFGVHDPIPLYKELVIGRNSSRWKFPHLDLHPGEKLLLPPVYLIPHNNGWRGGSECYRAWAQQHVNAPDTPDWYARKPTWAWVGLRGQHERTIWQDTTCLPEISGFVAQAGVDLLQLTAYTEDGHDTLYPDYRPGPSVGGRAGLQEAVTTIHRSGKWISIYTNGRLVDPASSVSPEARQCWGVRSEPEADVKKEPYGSVVFDVMCPGAPGWRSLFIEKLEFLVKTFDIDGIYIDQVCGCRSLPCYAPDHDHARPNQAWSHYRTFMKELRERLTALKPGIFLATEGVNDFLGQYFDSQQAHNDWTSLTRERGVPLPDLFRTTFPGHLLNVGCITDEPGGPYYLKLAHVSGGGCDFGVWDWKEMPPGFLDLARAVLAWYTQHAENFRCGVISPLEEETNTGSWRINAFSQPSRIVVNGAWLDGSAALSRPSRCSVRVPLPEDSVLQGVRFLGTPGAVVSEWIYSNGGIEIHFEGGAEIFGASVFLKKDAAS